jgi:hypothetical protein
MNINSDSTRTATLLPLEYGERLETCVSYFSTNWEELVDILDMPQEALLLLGRGWPVMDAPPAAKDMNWTLKGPITAVIEPAWKTVHAAVRVASHLAAVGGETTAASQSSLSQVDLSASPTELAGHFKASFLETAAAENGCFLVEFALRTSFLNIYYVPPAPVTEGAQARFTSGISDVTLSHIVADTPAGEQVVSATLHFDLGTECPPPPPMLSRDRANLIVDTLVSRSGLLELLDKPIKIGDGKMTPRGETIYYPEIKITEKLPFKVRDNSYPRVVAEGLGASPDCCVCTITQVEIQDSDYILGDMYYKLYCPTPPPIV